MKPLYWTRIVARPPPVCNTAENPSTPSTSNDRQLWQEIDETPLDNLDEFIDLFSRQVVVPKQTTKELTTKESSLSAKHLSSSTNKSPKVQAIKVLDSKRSQTVDIFSRNLSRHVDFAEIEHAIYHCDTSVVSLDTLQQLMEIKATSEELCLIKEALCARSGDSGGGGGGVSQLDVPEQFLLKIANFSCSAERISCIVFQANFDEGCNQVGRRMENIENLCEWLIENEDLKQLFSIILTLGNFMNGGNRTRGQADGFDIEILGKLKDVKSKNSGITLLHFIVKTYISQRRKNGVPLPEVVMPIPDAGDVAKAEVIDFKELEVQINGLRTKLEGKLS